MRAPTNDTIGFLAASRIPNLIIIALTQFIVARFLLEIPLWQLMKINSLLFIISTGMIGAAGYIINDYFDQKIDMVNRPGTVIIGTQLGRRLALLAHFILTVSGIAIGFLVDPFVGTVHIFAASALWLYSAQLKRWILLGTLTISFLSSLTLLLVMIYFKDFSLLVVAYAMFGGVTIFIRESIKDIISAKGEIQFGIHSIPIVWGIRGAKLTIFAAGVIGIAMLSFYLWSLPNWPLRYFFLGVLLFIFFIARQLANADKISDFKKIKTYIDIIIFAGLVSILLV